MTNEELLRAAEVMRRAANGEHVQWRARHGKGNWEEFNGRRSPVWGWDTDEYRIKPKPREVWVNAEDMQVRNNNPAESMGWSEPWKWRKFREVIDD